MKLLTELKVKVGYNESDIFEAIRKKYGVYAEEIEFYEIVKEGLDSRKKPNIFYWILTELYTLKTSLSAI